MSLLHLRRSDWPQRQESSNIKAKGVRPVLHSATMLFKMSTNMFISHSKDNTVSDSPKYHINNLLEIVSSCCFQSLH